MPEKDTVGIGPYETLCKKMLKSLVRNPIRDFLSHRRAPYGQTIGPTEAQQEIWEKIFLGVDPWSNTKRCRILGRRQLWRTRADDEVIK
jgi:hypothetical protein